MWCLDRSWCISPDFHFSLTFLIPPKTSVKSPLSEINQSLANINRSNSFWFSPSPFPWKFPNGETKNGDLIYRSGVKGYWDHVLKNTFRQCVLFYYYYSRVNRKGAQGTSCSINTKDQFQPHFSGTLAWVNQSLWLSSHLKTIHNSWWL